MDECKPLVPGAGSRASRHPTAPARASSGNEAGPSSSSPSESPASSSDGGGGGGGQQQQQQREQKPGFSQTAAIDILGTMSDNPWSVNTYHSKRAAHKVNQLGDIVGEDAAPENILEQPGWGLADIARRRPTQCEPLFLE